MSLRKMRKTLDSEEKLKNENEYSVNDLFKKSFENYFHHVWLELYSFQTNNSNHPKLLIKIEELLRINHRLLNVTRQSYYNIYTHVFKKRIILDNEYSLRF